VKNGKTVVARIPMAGGQTVGQVALA